MGNNISDAMQLLRRVLINDLSIQNYVSGRVYTTHFIDYDSKTTPMPLIILEFDGGDANYGMGNQRVSVRIYTYSDKSSSEASEIYSLVYDAVNGAVLKNNSLTLSGYCYESSRPTTGFNNNVRGWYFTGVFVLNTAG